MNMHVGTPAESAGLIESGPAIQERERQTALETIARLRKEASAEINRLIAFMDETDGYTTSELEEAVDDVGCCDNELEKSLAGISAHDTTVSGSDPMGDLEDDSAEDEPSLGSLTSCAHAGDQSHWGRDGGGIDLEDSGLGDGDLECDGLTAGEMDRSDDEPSLGWTGNGGFGSSDGMDREVEGTMRGDDVKAARKRKGKDKGVGVERYYSGSSRLTALSPGQKKALAQRDAKVLM